MDFTMDSETWQEVVHEDTDAVTDDSTQGVNEALLTSTSLPILSLGKLHETSSFILPLIVIQLVRVTKKTTFTHSLVNKALLFTPSQIPCRH